MHRRPGARGDSVARLVQLPDAVAPQREEGQVFAIAAVVDRAPVRAAQRHVRECGHRVTLIVFAIAPAVTTSVIERRLDRLRRIFELKRIRVRRPVWTRRVATTRPPTRTETRVDPPGKPSRRTAMPLLAHHAEPEGALERAAARTEQPQVAGGTPPRLVEYRRLADAGRAFDHHHRAAAVVRRARGVLDRGELAMAFERKSRARDGMWTPGRRLQRRELAGPLGSSRRLPRTTSANAGAAGAQLKAEVVCVEGDDGLGVDHVADVHELVRHVRSPPDLVGVGCDSPR